MPRAVLLFVLVVAMSGLGCHQELGRPPIPRFTMRPEYVPLGDDFRTEVLLDASASNIGLGDPDSPLSFDWRFGDDDVRIVQGDASSFALTIKVAGDRPVAITLTVETDNGQASTLEQRLGVTIPEL